MRPNAPEGLTSSCAKPCHNILSVSGYFRRLTEVKETDSALPPEVRWITIHPRVSRVRTLRLIALFSPARASMRL